MINIRGWHLSRVLLNWRMCLNMQEQLHYLNANRRHWCRYGKWEKGGKEHLWFRLMFPSSLPPLPTCHRLPFISWSKIGFTNCKLCFLCCQWNLALPSQTFALGWRISLRTFLLFHRLTITLDLRKLSSAHKNGLRRSEDASCLRVSKGSCH